MTTPGPPQRLVSRRLLLTAAALSLPVLAGCDLSQGIPDPGPGVTARSGRLRTRHWPGYRPEWIVMQPAHAASPRVVISLHGKGGDARATFSDLRLQEHIVATGLSVASIDGGNYYWHARRSESTGDDTISASTPPCDTGAMVRDDFIPLLARLGLDVTRVGLLGWSMGGYGALLQGALLGPSAVAAVAPMSAALWEQPGLSAPGAFDDAEDWQRNDVFGDLARFAGIPIRLACGTSDPFYAADTRFVEGFPATSTYDVRADFGPGGHDGAFWQGHGASQMTFLASHLSER